MGDDDKDLYAGLVRLHILHHAVEEGPVYGLWMIEELGRHGYRLSAGTLYPILHGLERKGYLTSHTERVGSRTRRLYHATPAGEQALAAAKQRVWELFGELFEPRTRGQAGERAPGEPDPPTASGAAAPARGARRGTGRSTRRRRES